MPDQTSSVKSQNQQTLRKIFRYIRPYWYLVILSLLLAAVTVALTLYVPILTGRAVDAIAGKDLVNFHTLFALITSIAVSISVTAAAQWIMNHVNNLITYRVVRDIARGVRDGEAISHSMAYLPLYEKLDTWKIHTDHCTPGQAAAQAAYTEELDDSIPGLSTTLIHNTVLRRGIPAGRMTAREKEELIGALDRQGVFSTKGAVGQAARELDISEPTVYRYLRRVRNR